jgi:diaminopimelate epimerase
MDKLQFAKMHGLGNDFILIDNREERLEQIDLLARRLCRRRFGIGADQLLLLEKSQIADYRMRIFNPDGSEVEMCGNGIRCLARYIKDKGLCANDRLLIETKAGTVKINREKDQIKVDMGEPILEGEKIPLSQKGEIISAPLVLDGMQFNITCVSMGNPHCVILMDDLQGFAVAEYGPQIEHHALFPKRTNVEFVRVLNQGQIEVKVWERGAGETLACGSGACASVVATVLNHKTQRTVDVNLPGGTLHICWSADDNHVYMRGPAEYVFDGITEIA